MLRYTLRVNEWNWIDKRVIKYELNLIYLNEINNHLNIHQSTPNTVKESRVFLYSFCCPEWVIILHLIPCTNYRTLEFTKLASIDWFISYWDKNLKKKNHHQCRRWWARIFHLAINHCFLILILSQNIKYWMCTKNDFSSKTTFHSKFKHRT